MALHIQITITCVMTFAPRQSCEHACCTAQTPLPETRRAGAVKVAEPAGKPGSVVDSHSSRRNVTVTLKQPTRRHCGPQHSLPIWSCSRWGLPCRSVAGLAVRSYRTISPLPRIPKNRSAVSFCCTFRRLAPPRRYLAPCPVEPGLSSALFPMTRLSGRLRRAHCRTASLPGRQRRQASA